jgi:hypothetical protein
MMWREWGEKEEKKEIQSRNQIIIRHLSLPPVCVCVCVQSRKNKNKKKSAQNFQIRDCLINSPGSSIN